MNGAVFAALALEWLPGLIRHASPRTVCLWVADGTKAEMSFEGLNVADAIKEHMQLQMDNHAGTGQRIGTGFHGKDGVGNDGVNIELGRGQGDLLIQALIADGSDKRCTGWAVLGYPPH